jgi:hypothetical protein
MEIQGSNYWPEADIYSIKLPPTGQKTNIAEVRYYSINILV